MKLLFSLLFGFFITSGLYAQNCKVLDNKSFFLSVKHGNQIPEDLIACLKHAKPEHSYFIRIEYDSLKASCKKRYADLFNFLSVPFSFSQIGANDKGQILSIQLYSFFDDNRKDSLIYTPPVNYTGIYTKLLLLYGQPTRVEEASYTDSLFVKEMGMPRLATWECNNITLQLRVRYGSRVKDLNVLEVSIRNRKFDIPEAEQISQ